MEIENCRISGQALQVHDIVWKTTGWIYMLRRATDKKPDAAQRKEKQKWAIEKRKLDIARKLRGIYFIVPADAEFKETNWKRWRKLEVPMPAAMSCKLQRDKYRETCRTSDARKTKHTCIVEAEESTRKRLAGTLHKDHEDHTAGKGINSWSHFNLVHKLMPMLQAMKTLDAKVKKYQHGSWRKSETKKEVIAEARQEGKTVHFSS